MISLGNLEAFGRSAHPARSRYDRALTHAFSPFDEHTDKDQWTLGLDVILQF